MTNEAYQIVQWFFATFWRFFNSWHIPGTGMTPAALFFLCAFVPLSLKLVSSIINNSTAPSSSSISRATNFKRSK